MFAIQIALFLILMLIAACLHWLRHIHLASQARHAELLHEFSRAADNLAAIEARQQQRNMDQLQAALSEVTADFHQRLMSQFEAQLQALVKLTRHSEELLHKQRDEQMEAMHHARRLADSIDASTAHFDQLTRENIGLLAVAGQVRETLSLAGVRQDKLDGEILRQAAAVDAMGNAMQGLRAGFEEAAENLLQQTRRSLDAMAQRQAQTGSALQKELSEALNKAVLGINKQLSIMAPAKLQTLR